MSAGRSAQTYEKWSFFSIFCRLGHFLQVFGQVNEWPVLEFHEMTKVLHAVACPIGLNLLCDQVQGGRSAQTYEKWSFSSVFSCLGPFSQVFGQAKGSNILELHEIIGVLYVVSWPIVLFCFVIETCREECSNLWKTVILSRFVVWDLTLKFLGSLRRGLY